MSFTPLSFVGLSQYSEDFQMIMQRTVSIASLPIKALQNEQKDLLQQKLLVSNLMSTVDALASKVAALGEVGARKALAASTTSPSKVRGTNVSATSAATYTITEITSVARVASETSVSGYTDSGSSPVSASGTVRLVVGSDTYDIDVSANNSLIGLRDAINQLGAGVTATIFTTGTGEEPNYLSITANAAGAKTLQLIDDPEGAATHLITSNNQGANTEFKLNGVPVSKTSTLINDVVPGLTFEIFEKTAPGEEIIVALGTDRNQVSSALSSLVGAYNELVDQVSGQIGEQAGLLSGNFLVREIQEVMRRFTGYNGTGAIKSLAEVGIELDRDGKMSFNSSTFAALSDSQVLGAIDLLGTSTTGLGGFAKQFQAISDPVTGLAKLQLDRYEAADLRLNRQIGEIADRVNVMQAGLLAKLQAADTILAQLESQRSMVETTVQSLQYVLYGRKDS